MGSADRPDDAAGATLGVNDRRGRELNESDGGSARNDAATVDSAARDMVGAVSGASPSSERTAAVSGPDRWLGPVACIAAVDDDVLGAPSPAPCWRSAMRRDAARDAAPGCDEAAAGALSEGVSDGARPGSPQPVTPPRGPTM